MYLTWTKQKISFHHESAVETFLTAMLLPWLPWKQICCFLPNLGLISAKNSNDIMCDIFNINLCEILNKNNFMFYDTVRFIIYQLFGINIEILNNINSSMQLRGKF